ncbi:MAG: response regulator receiver protein [Epulopiscium sp. Nele67-Bin004]|nr:MAG: response regulator receiver protein [Epulopiscium sp. Nele67-Bin004]
MLNVLMVSYVQPSKEVLSDMLPVSHEIYTSHSCSEARRLLLERKIDIVIINTPLKDETGEKLAKDIACQGATQVILMVGSEHYEQIASKVEQLGVIMVAKPLNKKILETSLNIAKVTYNRLRLLERENTLLNKKIDDIRIISRAKCILIEKGMSELQAHKYIEKEAMDTRRTRKEISETIIQNYEVS